MNAEPIHSMIPESLQKQNRALMLSTAKHVLCRKLSAKDESELRSLEREAEAAAKANLRRAFAQADALEANRKKAKGLNLGTYAACVQAA